MKSKLLKNLKFQKGNRIGDISRKINITGINVYLRRLFDKGILKVQNKGEYYIVDRILWEYIQRK